MSLAPVVKRGVGTCIVFATSENPGADNEACSTLLYMFHANEKMLSDCNG